MQHLKIGCHKWNLSKIKDFPLFSMHNIVIVCFLIEFVFRTILEWMCGEGHIYSTIDEEHFRATDAF